NVFLGNDTTDHFVDELQTFLTLIGRRETHPAMTELAAAARLPNELAFDLARLGDLLAIGNLRLTDVGIDVELAAHTVYQDIQVQFTHPGDDGLTGFFVSLDAERRVFLRK